MTKALTYVEIDVPTFAGGSPIGTQTFRFAQPTDYLPNTIDAIPSIASISFTPSTISLGENLGMRASLKIAFMDHRHIFNGEPYDQGSFWGKWRGRYGTKLRGCSIRLIRGILGQSINEMETRYYIVDSTDGPTPDAAYGIEAKDVLKLADDDRAQAPNISNGKLAGSINNSTTSAALSPAGIGDLEYPASGWLCLGGKEVVAFTRSGDSLAITRGQFGSVAAAHDAGDRAQLVLRYAGDDVADILYDLLVTYASIPADYINLAEWQAETAAHLGVIYAATITEATSVKKLVAELIQQAALALWWDDRAQKIRLQVLREISTDADTFGEDRILEGSLQVKEQPDKRISQIWSYYGQRDPTDQAAKEDGYRAALASVDLDLEAAYGSAAVTKIQCRWIETLSAAERLNQIQLSRFRDPPRNFTFALKFDELVSLAGGYQLSWWANQDAEGNAVPAKIQITKIERLADRLNIEAEEMLASGVIVLTHTVILLDDGALRSWVVPDTWNDADNEIACIGAGSGGMWADNSSNASHGGGGAGGGGGAYSAVTNVTLTPGASISYRIGTGGTGGNAFPNIAPTAGGDTWFGASTFGAATVAAKGATAPSGRTSVGIGGQASDGIGAVKFSGGDGGTGALRSSSTQDSGGGGGGAAAGPHGDGGGGGDNFDTSQNGGAGGGGADGGDAGIGAGGDTGGNGGNNRFAFGGGTSSQSTGDEGGGGKGADHRNFAAGGPGGAGEQLYTQTEAPIISAGPGGGGGGGGTETPGFAGGLYGGGGGGSGNAANGGNGAKGMIAISWREAPGSP